MNDINIYHRNYIKKNNIKKKKNNIKGRIPWFEQGYTMPHTAVLPLNYTHLKPREKFEFSFLIHEIIVLPLNYLGYIIYLGAIRTLINKYQKFRTYLLVNEIFTDNKIRTYTLLILSETCLPIAAYLFMRINLLTSPS